MHRMLAFSPVPEDGTSLARSFGVWPKLRKKLPFQFVPIHGLANGRKVNWNDLQDIDSLFLQRAFMPEQLQIAELARINNIPMIADYDDDLFTVPKDNPTHSTYGQAWAQQNVESACKGAACVTVSTETLGEKLRKFNSNVRVIPNALDLDMLKPLPQELARNPVVVWRGSHCHVRDLQVHADAILHAYEKFPNYNFMFVGYDPWWITEKMNPERVRILQFDGSYLNYMRNLAKIRGAIQIVPLADIPFNHSKSNIAFLEGSFAGSAMLTPDFDDWKITPGIKYQGANDFEVKLFELMSTPLPELARIATEGFQWVEKYRSLNLMNDLRLDVLKKYCKA